MGEEMNKPTEVFFSIIVPSYNRAALIGKTLQTLTEQDYPNFEIIVVDDGSIDNTEDIVKNIADGRIRYFKKENEERAAARNFGALKARGEYVNFFDSDDLALPGHLSEAMKLISKKKSPEWFFLAYAIVNPSRKILSRSYTFNGDTINKMLLNGNMIGCNGVFVRRDIFLSNRFNADRILAASEDYELWCRLAARYPLYYSNTITSQLVQHDLRSVNQITGYQLTSRIHSLINYLKKDAAVTGFFGNEFNKIIMHLFAYTALHLSDRPSFKMKSIKYLLKAMSQSQALVTKRIFYASMRNIIFRW